MALHVIIGRGNLGLDIQLAFDERGHKTHLMSRTLGFSWPQSKAEILDLQPDYVWVAAGHGSVSECERDFSGAIQTHVTLPVELAQSLSKNTCLGLFSTDYAANETEPGAAGKQAVRPRSLYAFTKIWMEQAILMMNRPKTAIFRVGSLYGSHFPERCFPGKLRKNYPNPSEVSLPQNWVTPTPTWWVAETICNHLVGSFNSSSALIHNIAPSGGCTIARWGMHVLGKDYTIKSNGFDKNRPSMSKLGSSFDKPAIEWEELWNISQLNSK